MSIQSTPAVSTLLRIKVGPHTFTAVLEEQRAPRTCAAFESLLPFRSQVIHTRWSGEATWIPLGDLDIGVESENATSYPAPGQLLWYPGGLSETELLLPYGGCRFASIVGQLAGNHFLTIIEGVQNLRVLGQLVLWHGAQEIEFERLDG